MINISTILKKGDEISLNQYEDLRFNLTIKSGEDTIQEFIMTSEQYEAFGLQIISSFKELGWVNIEKEKEPKK